MNPYQPGEDNQDPYEVGYKDGAASRDAEIAELVAALEITHELYANASQGYGLYRPDNPHRFCPDIDCCSKEEISAHAKACDDYAAGRKIANESWGIGTYNDEYEPAVKLIAKVRKQ